MKNLTNKLKGKIRFKFITKNKVRVKSKMRRNTYLAPGKWAVKIRAVEKRTVGGKKGSKLIFKNIFNFLNHFDLTNT